MTTYTLQNSYNLNLGNPLYGGANNFLFGSQPFIHGTGYYDNGTGKNAVYSNVAGLTLTSQTGLTIRAGSGSAQLTPAGTGGAGGIGVDLQASDVFNNGGTVEGGGGGGYANHNGLSFQSIGPGGPGNDGVLLSHGAVLNNTGTVDGGLGGGTFLSGSAGGSTTFIETGPAGIGVDVAGGQVANTGKIVGGGFNNISTGGVGVQLDTGSTANYLDNTATGTIAGGSGNAGGGAGVNFVAYNQVALKPSNAATPGTIYNQGKITGGNGYLKAGGDGIDIAANQGFTAGGLNTDLVNTGTIQGGAGNGGGIGVKLVSADLGYSDGTILGGDAQSQSNANGGVGLSVTGGSEFFSNGGTIQGGAGDGSGSGGAGAYIGDGATLGLFATTIAGGYAGGSGGASGAAIQFAATGSGMLSVSVNDAFTGQVAASYSAYDALSLSDTGVLSGGLGTQFTGFSQLNFASGASWTVDATAVGITKLASVYQFAIGDTLDVTNLQYGSIQSTSFNPSNVDGTSGTLSITGTSNTYNINFAKLPSGTSFQFSSDGAGGTDISLACYIRGTRILTERGEVPIEELAIGDRVVCHLGGSRPVRWLGHRQLDCSRYSDPRRVWPIRIEAGALAPKVPARDLWVSPGHSIFIDGALIQACELVNGATIVPEPRARVEYWHVELDAHDIVFADGMPSESYLDTGNRCAFANGGAFLEAFPDFEPKHWSATCVPLVSAGEALARARTHLMARAEQLGYRLTANTHPCVVADGERIMPISLGAERMAFVIPPARRGIELRCRTFVPCEIDPASRDGRELGLCVGRLQVDGNDLSINDTAHFREGWHTLESVARGHDYRWSGGRFPLPAGSQLVVIDLAGPSYCWDHAARSVGRHHVASA